MIAKDPQTIENLRHAGKLMSSILLELTSAVKPGVSAADLDLMAEKLIKENGAEPVFLNYKNEGSPYPYPAVLCASVNDEVVHGIPKDTRVIEEGDVVSLDLGLSFNGAIIDAARTIIVGSGDEDARRLVQGTKEALEAAISVASAGNTVGDIGAAVSEVARKYNLGVVEELGGHATGKKLHEQPFISNVGEKGEGEKLVTGMVLALEPIFTLGKGDIETADDQWTYMTVDHSRAAHFEDTILITENGAEVLSR